MAGIDEIPPRRRPLSLSLVPLIGADELLLFVRVGLPEEAGGLVVADADAVQQVPHTPRGIADAKGLLDPVADLLGGQEATGGDLGLESLDLSRSEFARVALMAEGTQGLQPLSAKEPEPLADLPFGDTEEFGGLVLGPALGNPQDSGESLGDSLVVGLATAAFDLLADRSVQCQCHGFPPNDTAGNQLPKADRKSVV